MSSIIELKAKLEVLESLAADQSYVGDKESLNFKIKDLKLKIADITNPAVKVESGSAVYPRTGQKPFSASPEPNPSIPTTDQPLISKPNEAQVQIEDVSF